MIAWRLAWMVGVRVFVLMCADLVIVARLVVVHRNSCGDGQSDPRRRAQHGARHRAPKGQQHGKQHEKPDAK